MEQNPPPGHLLVGGLAEQPLSPREESRATCLRHTRPDVAILRACDILKVGCTQYPEVFFLRFLRIRSYRKEDFPGGTTLIRLSMLRFALAC